MRCACCNRVLKASEIIWYPKQQRHEDLCLKCRSIIYDEFIKMGWNTDRSFLYEGDVIEEIEDE